MLSWRSGCLCSGPRPNDFRAGKVPGRIGTCTPFAWESLDRDGVLLLQYRTTAGLSQEELADRAGLSRRGISDLERGQRRWPYPATVRRLADALGLAEADRADLLGAARTPGSRGTLAGDALGAMGDVRHHLPLALTSFIGREHDVAEVQRLLSTTRLLTLSGPGGIGKTRLALQVVQSDTNGQAGRARFIDLSPLVEASLVPQTVAASLGVRELPGHQVIKTLVAAIGDDEVLLVLDNCEHVLGECAYLAEALLRGCPGVRLLATSRETLRVPGEVVWQVPPLSLPEPQPPTEPDRLMHSEAVRLFLARAKEARAGFALRADNAGAVAAICRRLDGMPLGIELAAARVRVLSAEQIADHLADRFALEASGAFSSRTKITASHAPAAV